MSDTRFVALVLCTLGCQASVQAQANVGASDASAPAEGAAARALAAPTGEQSALPTAPALLGVRSGLSLKSPARQVCTCLAVVVGQPNNPAFVWEGAPEQIDVTSQLVIAIRSEYTGCDDATSDSLGASYAGYEVSGKDVIVSVEAARLGRPLVHGAVIPRPPSGGKIVVRPLDNKTPYGQNKLQTTEPCVVSPAGFEN